MSPEEVAARALLDDVATVGIRLWVEGGRLLFEAPEGALTDDLKTRFQPLRGEVIAILSGRRRTQNQLTAANSKGGDRRYGDDGADPFEDPAAHWKRHASVCPPDLAATLSGIAAAWSSAAVHWATVDASGREHKGKKHPESLRAWYERIWTEAGALTVSKAIAPWLARQAERWTWEVPAQAAPIASTWGEDDAPVMAWAAALQPADVPPVPFTLRPGVTVADAALFLAALRFDVALGPTGPRARFGVLRRVVDDLQEAIAAWERDREQGPKPVGLRLVEGGGTGPPKRRRIGK